MAKLVYSTPQTGYDPNKIKPLVFNPVNPIEQDNTKVQYKIDPLLQAKKLQIAEKVKAEEKKKLALEYYNKRKGQTLVGGFKGTPEQQDQFQKDVAEYSANNQIEMDNTSFEDKAKSVAWNTLLALGPEVIIAKGLPALKPVLKDMSVVSKEGDEILPLMNIPKTNKYSFAPITNPLKTEPAPNILTLKAISSGNPLEKQLGKNGEISVGQIRNYLLKPELSNADKTIITNVLNKKYLNVNKIDYKEFKQSISDELIPLNRYLSDTYADYGIDRLGFSAVKGVNENIDNTWNIFGVDKRFPNKESAESYLKQLTPRENKSIVFENKEQFGIGDATHFSDRGTLGHSRYMVTNEEPDVYHLLENQSDYFQKKLSPGQITVNKINSDPHIKEVNEQRIANWMESAKKDEELAKNMRYMYENNIPDKFGNKIHLSQVEQFETMVREGRINTQIRIGNLRNQEQKIFLGKNHQDRFLQENVAYAAKNGQTKMRIPTSETAAKIEGYTKETLQTPITPEGQLPEPPTTITFGETGPGTQYYAGTDYRPEHKTILKKYDEMPKNVKRLFGIDTKLVIDPKGNSWHEFDIPKNFITGGAEIKALSLLPIGVGVKATSTILKPKIE